MSAWSYILAPAPSISGEESLLPTSVDDTGEEHCLAQHTSVVVDGQELLLFQFQDSPRLKALLAIYLKQIQEVEDALWLELQQRDINQAAGIYLDQIGDLIGQPRSGLADLVYRDLLRARIAANRSRGTSADIIDVIQALFGNAGILSEDYPAKVIYDTDALVSLYDLDTVFQVLRASVSSGIQFMLIYQLSPTANLFKFAPPGGAVVVDANHGFGNTAQTTGGKLRGARVI